MKIYILIGTRPNFIKVTQFKSLAAKLFPAMQISIIHTGQHYDDKMADVFFKQFNLVPDHYLNISPTSPNKQIAEIMINLENLLDHIGKPDLLLLIGDVNSTIAGALFANKCGIKTAHVEAGLRSFDPSMPEEYNRVITDYLTDLYFTTEASGGQHLLDEKHNSSKIHFVGNTMIDTMLAYQGSIDDASILEDLKLFKGQFVLMTMHRPETVDNKESFLKLLELIAYVSIKNKIVFPAHPRTIKRAKQFGLYETMISNVNLICIDPLGYFAFQNLIKNCFFILTDSGGLQEESTYLQKPCLTLRPNTERPVTVNDGTNTVLDFDINVAKGYVEQIEKGIYKKGRIPPLWDGKATERILHIINQQ